MTPVWVIGSGGHAKVVIATLARWDRSMSPALDDDPGRWSAQVLGVPVRGGTLRGSINQLGVKCAIIAVGSNHARVVLAQRLSGCSRGPSRSTPLPTWPRAFTSGRVPLSAPELLSSRTRISGGIQSSTRPAASTTTPRLVILRTSHLEPISPEASGLAREPSWGLAVAFCLGAP